MTERYDDDKTGSLQIKTTDKKLQATTPTALSLKGTVDHWSHQCCNDPNYSDAYQNMHEIEQKRCETTMAIEKLKRALHRIEGALETAEDSEEKDYSILWY